MGLSALSGLSGLSALAGGHTSLVNGLVAYWKLNEAAGSPRAESVSGGSRFTLAETDQTGGAPQVRTNAGLVYPLAAEFLVADVPARYLIGGPGIRGSALDPDGTDFTLAIWYVNYTQNEGLPHYRALVSTGENNNSGGIFEGLTQLQAFGYFYRRDNTSSGVVHASGNTLNAWHLVVYQYDSARDVCRGTLADSIAWDETADTQGARALLAGYDYWCVGLMTGGQPNRYPFDGRVGPIAFWNRLLSDGEIARYYNGGAGRRFEEL